MLKLMKEKRKQQYSKQVKQRNRLELASKSHRDLAPDNQLQQEDATDKRTIVKTQILLRFHVNDYFMRNYICT